MQVELYDAVSGFPSVIFFYVSPLPSFSKSRDESRLRARQPYGEGLITGQYEAKVDGGFLPGGASLHSCMTPHGPDAGTFDRASAEGACDTPTAIAGDALAFMFEMDYIPRVTAHALASPALDKDYYRRGRGKGGMGKGEGGKLMLG